MAEQGWRERKKTLTRRALIEAGLRLFRDQGYQETSIAQVAAAAGVAPRTFFGYFAGKEDLVFADTPARIETALRVVDERGPEDTVADVLTRVAEETIAGNPGDVDLLGLASGRMDLVMSTPSLQGAALHRLWTTEQRLAGALLRAFPDDLDEVSAAMVVGSFAGAFMGAAGASLRRGDRPDEVRAAVGRAVRHAARGIRAGVG
ncbi:TetR family transcriptional regulator [Murinocardiopsis flavida]|uniref:TetR family transcriptional regulator n=1 Tax=Murinocardiopsis flavida TaxID=645275 RepID=A0A2P8D6E5_9ACTN|nr:TetR/AcrR family transcriptional regulator [Murinocardiopsis flavida]PSK92800.1 TetR family transcriptional regulator [Murinocardiopsis flavida]